MTGCAPCWRLRWPLRWALGRLQGHTMRRAISVGRIRGWGCALTPCFASSGTLPGCSATLLVQAVLRQCAVLLALLIMSSVLLSGIVQ